MLNIAYCCNDAYAPYVSVSMISCIENNINDFDKIVFHIIEENVSQESKLKLQEIINSYSGCEIKFYPFKLDLKIPESHYPPIGYSTLFLSDYLDIDRVIYLDADTLILNSFKELYDVDFKENYCAGVLDITNSVIKGYIGFAAEDKYYNAGVLLINLNKIREDGIDKIFREECTKVYRFHDQDIINKTLKDRILTVSPKYDLFGYFLEMDYKYVLKIFSVEGEFYTESEVDDAKENLVCAHFINLFSDVPWRDETNPMYGKFKMYAEMSTFSEDEIFSQATMPLWKIWAHKIVKKIPPFLYAPLAKRYLLHLLK